MKSKKSSTVLSAVFIIVLLAVYFITSAGTEKTPEDGMTKSDHTEYRFRSVRLLEEHYNKHGIEMGFGSSEEYEKAASDCINDPEALHKLEKEDGDDVYYIEDTNEFVILSRDGYIRTYFCPDSGKAYYDRQ